MKRTLVEPARIRAATTLLSAIALAAPATARAPVQEKLFFGVEMGGTLIGYAEMRLTPHGAGGDGPARIESSGFAKLTLLGQDVDVRQEEVYRLDPRSGRVLSYESRLDMGTIRRETNVTIEGDVARIEMKPGGAPRELTLPPGAIVNDSLHFAYLVADLGSGGPAERKYSVLDFDDGTIHETTYTRAGEEVLTLEGAEHPCLVFELVDHKTGLRGRLWIERAGGRVFKATLPNETVVKRAAPAVVGMIQRVELDDTLFARVDVAVADFQAITYMKVRATVEALGQPITVESLNVPGQRFTGTVEDNLIDGVFEIEHARYTGEGAPPYPPDLGARADLREVLQPEVMIESDDPLLRDAARGIAEGAEDSWEALRRLSQWVADEITYEIPGGSARATYDSRRGECGSHSRLLVALCRGAGIPARLACGAMYTPHYGGSFGQHAWTEVYMGEAGWIPVDATAHEIDYVDSGHLRLGSQVSFAPRAMEVLAHRVGSGRGPEPVGLGTFEELPWKAGETYTYRYVYQGTPIGTDVFTFERLAGDQGGWACSTKLDLTGRSASSQWRIDRRGRPLHYEMEGRAGAVEYSIECAFSEDAVAEKVVQSSRTTQKTISLPDPVYLVDNNNFSGFAALAAAAPMAEGAVYVFKVFHPATMQVLPVQLTVSGRERIPFGDEERDCAVCSLVLAGTPLKLWVDGEGRILRETEAGGRLVVELVPPQ